MGARKRRAGRMRRAPPHTPGQHGIRGVAMSNRFTRRRFIGYGAAAAGAVALWPACSSGSSSSDGGGDGNAQGELPDIESAELVTDPAQIPTRFNERPEFADMVAAGTLPPVAERIGQDPLVLSPLSGIGRYGGKIRRAYLGVSDYKKAPFFSAGPDCPLHWDRTLTQLVPNVAKGWELSDDGMEMLLHMRQGMRWSDGEPFNADDIMFWRNDLSLHPELPGLGASLQIAGQPVQVDKVDDFTVR